MNRHGALVHAALLLLPVVFLGLFFQQMGWIGGKSGSSLEGHGFHASYHRLVSDLIPGASDSKYGSISVLSQRRVLLHDGEPGDEAWIDGIIDEREKSSFMGKFLERHKQKADERRKEHEISNIQPASNNGSVNNCSLPSEALGVQCAPG